MKGIIVSEIVINGNTYQLGDSKEAVGSQIRVVINWNGEEKIIVFSSVDEFDQFISDLNAMEENK